MARIVNPNVTTKLPRVPVAAKPVVKPAGRIANLGAYAHPAKKGKAKRPGA